MRAAPPTWLDGRNPDWERATLRSAPPMATWPAHTPSGRQRLARWLDVIETALAIAGGLLFVMFIAVGLLA